MMIKKLSGNQKGSVMIIVTISLLVLVGFAGLAIDGGSAYLAKSRLQISADAAALAGAKDLPSITASTDKAIEYAQKNGMQVVTNHVENMGDTVDIDPRYEDDSDKIEVVCSRRVSTPLLSLLGFGHSTVRARAVGFADFTWDGEALPFCNTGFVYEEENVILRLNTSPGDKSQIMDFYTMTYDDQVHAYVKYDDGVVIDEGNGNTQSNLDPDLGYDTDMKLNGIMDEVFQYISEGDRVYIFSIQNDIIDNYVNHGGKITVTDKDGTKGVDRYNTKKGGLKAGDIIDVKMLVLLECEYITRKEANNTEIEVSSVRVWDFNNGEFPEDYVGPPGSADPKLIQ